MKNTQKSMRLTQDYMNACSRAFQNLEISFKWMDYVMELEKQDRSEDGISGSKVKFIMTQMAQLRHELNVLRANKLKELKDLEVQKSEERRQASRKTLQPKLTKAVRGKSMIEILSAKKQPSPTT